MFHKVACIIAPVILFLAAACQFTSPTHAPVPTIALPTLERAEPTSVAPSQSPVPSLIPTPLPRHLSICLGREPRSLFLYDAAGSAAQNVLAAVYDGPFEIQNFNNQPVILEKMPALSDGDVRLEAVEVQPGGTLVDADGDLNTLAEGVRYRPSGCSHQDCARIYAGDQPATLDRLVVHFRILPQVRWSDGSPVRADDSVFSYQVAQALAPTALPDLLLRTASYQALDEQTVEWIGVPGYVDGDYSRKFFSPLPRHAWGLLPVSDLRISEVAAQMPLGWGPYAIQEWVAGDHITLAKNPYYFRLEEGLPRFDHLVFRFVSSGADAVDALLAGECDLVDSSLHLEASLVELDELESQGSLQVIPLPEVAWEIALFGIDSLQEGRPDFFGSAEVRRAIAMCLDRQALVDRLFQGQTPLAESYLPSTHPLFKPDLAFPEYDPAGASQILQDAGWVDPDGDPAMPRLAQGVADVPDGTPFEFTYRISSDEEHQVAAEILGASLADCGLHLTILAQEAGQYLAPGPDGPVFGRRFDMAQFAWPTSLTPPCALFLSREVPGPYPEFPKGWGGANASGYRRPEYDQICQDALQALPDAPGYLEAHWRAQELFVADLPAIPLYWRFAIELGRPDLCGSAAQSGARNSLETLEQLDYGEACK